MKKRLLAIVLSVIASGIIVVGILIFYNNGNRVLNGNDKLESYRNKTSFITVTEYGILTFDDSLRLIFADGNSHEWAYVCSDINCEHLPYDMNNPISECPAVFPTLNNTILMDDEYIYIISSDRNEWSYDKKTLYRENTDGTDIKKLCTFDNVQDVGSAQINEGKIFFTFNNTLDYTDELDPKPLESSQSGIIIYDPETEKCTRIDAEQKDSSENMDISYLDYSQGIVYFHTYSIKNGGKPVLRLYTYDMEKDRQELLNEEQDSQIVCIKNGCYAYRGDGLTLFRNGSCKKVSDALDVMEGFILNNALYYYVIPEKEWYEYNMDTEENKAIGKSERMYETVLLGEYVWFDELILAEDGIIATEEDYYRIKVSDFIKGDFNKKEKVYVREFQMYD